MNAPKHRDPLLPDVFVFALNTEIKRCAVPFNARHSDFKREMKHLGDLVFARAWDRVFRQLDQLIPQGPIEVAVRAMTLAAIAAGKRTNLFAACLHEALHDERTTVPQRVLRLRCLVETGFELTTEESDGLYEAIARESGAHPDWLALLEPMGQAGLRPDPAVAARISPEFAAATA